MIDVDEDGPNLLSKLHRLDDSCELSSWHGLSLPGEGASLDRHDSDRDRLARRVFGRLDRLSHALDERREPLVDLVDASEGRAHLDLHCVADCLKDESRRHRQS